jgi:hypothetical protein
MFIEFFEVFGVIFQTPANPIVEPVALASRRNGVTLDSFN